MKSPAPLYSSFSILSFSLHIYFLFPVNQRVTSKLLSFSLKTLFYTDRSHISYHHNCSWDFFQSSQNHMLNVLISFPTCLSKSQFLTLWVTISHSVWQTPLLNLCKHFLTSSWKKVSKITQMATFSQAINGSRYYWMRPAVPPVS